MTAPSLRIELQQQKTPKHDFGADITPLAIPVEWMHYCDVCNSEQVFLAKESCSLGLIGRCRKCDEVRVGRWTRTNTEIPHESADWEAYT